MRHEAWQYRTGCLGQILFPVFMASGVIAALVVTAGIGMLYHRMHGRAMFESANVPEDDRRQIRIELLERAISVETADEAIALTEEAILPNRHCFETPIPGGPFYARASELLDALQQHVCYTPLYSDTWLLEWHELIYSLATTHEAGEQVWYSD